MIKWLKTISNDLNQREINIEHEKGSPSSNGEAAVEDEEISHLKVGAKFKNPFKENSMAIQWNYQNTEEDEEESTEI